MSNYKTIKRGKTVWGRDGETKADAEDAKQLPNLGKDTAPGSQNPAPVAPMKKRCSSKGRRYLPPLLPYPPLNLESLEIGVSFL